MQLTRQALLSFVTYLREDVLIRDSVYRDYDDIALSLVSGKEYRNTSYKNWIYYVPADLSVTNYPVVVKDSGVTVSSSNYTINYVLGTVTFVAGYTINGAITASFAALHHFVSCPYEAHYHLLDEQLPNITVTDITRSPRPLQLGGANESYFNIIVMLTEYSREMFTAIARVMDLKDIITDSLNSVEILEFPPFPLRRSGAKDSSYNRVTQLQGYFAFDEISFNEFSVPVTEDHRVTYELMFTLSTPE